MTDGNLIIVEPIAEDAGDGYWNPVVGPEAHDFLQIVVPEASREGVRDAAVSILAKGLSPTVAEGQETGLVVGYVQSGKTMSFEAVATLARDNGFHMVIVVVGTATLLLVEGI